MTGAKLSARTGSPSAPPSSRVYYAVQAELDVYTIPEIMPLSPFPASTIIILFPAAVNAAAVPCRRYGCIAQKSPHEAVYGVVQSLDRLLVARLHRIHDAVADVILQNHPSRAVQRRDHRTQLHQNLRAIFASFHHAADGVEVTLGAAEAVQNGFRLLMGVMMFVVVQISFPRFFAYFACVSLV